MTRNTDQKRSAQKSKQQALLNELESIKDLLDDEELLNKEELLIDDSLISNEDELLIDDDLIVEKATNNLDIPLLQEMVEYTADEELVAEATDSIEVPQSTSTTPLYTDHTGSTPGVLPGQQSLFTEQKAQKIDPPEPKVDTVKSNSPHSKLKKASGENPFLPKHIRDRLSGTIDVPDYDFLYGNNPNDALVPRYPNQNESQANTANLSKTPSADYSPNNPVTATALEVDWTALQNDSGYNHLIDSLVAQYLPELELKLRERLREAIASPNKPKSKQP